MKYLLKSTFEYLVVVTLTLLALAAIVGIADGVTWLIVQVV